MRLTALALTAAALMIAPAADAGEATTLDGTWVLLSTQTHGTCASVMRGTLKSETWTISTSGNAITAEVVPARKRDTPAFPVFTGTWDPATDTAVLEGVRGVPEENVDPVVWWRLVLADGALEGQRRYLDVERNPDRPETLSGGRKPCFVDSEVEGSRQGD